jgi:hypothetical protein
MTILKSVMIGLVLSASLSAQQELDRVLVRFGNDMVTQLDVRQARMLKLFAGVGDSEQAYVDALVNRRLMLADLRRASVAEPAPDAVEAKYREWQARVGPGATDLLAQAGMTDAELRGWLRDDLRLQTYVSERFGGRDAEIDSWLSVLRQRAGLK